jgi:hypothetical protein
MVQIEARWSSREVNGRIKPFTPVIAAVQGQVFTPKLSALMTINQPRRKLGPPVRRGMVVLIMKIY